MVATATRCLRKAAYTYFSDHPREPRTEGTTLGDEVHAAFEAYAQTGASPPPDTHAGLLFRAGLPYIPRPGVGHAEQRREMTLGGHRYTILMDWYGQARDLPGSGELEGPAVLDFKTSANPRQYGVGIAPDKKPIADPQVVIYSAFALVDSSADKVYGRWLYLPTKVKNPKGMPSDFAFSKQEISDAFGEKIYPVSMLLGKIDGERPDPNTVQPNAMACGDYRGCWYAEENGGPCRLTDQDRKDALRRALIEGEEDDMGLRDLANKAKAKQTPEAPINPPDEVVEVPPEEDTKKPATKKATTKKAPAPAPAGGQAEAIGAGVLAILDAVKERWG